MKSRFAESDVECLNFAKGKFKVKNSSKSQLYYMVDLQIPRCTCEAWLKKSFSLQAFFAVFNAFDEFSFNLLSESYKNCVFITLDVSHAEYVHPNHKDDGKIEKPDSTPSRRNAKNDDGNGEDEAEMDYNIEDIHKISKSSDSSTSRSSHPQPGLSSSQPKEANLRKILLK